MHSMQVIANTGSLPMVKKPIPAASTDDRTKGRLFAQECIALTVGQSNPWRDMAERAFDMTIEARGEAVKALDLWKKAKTEELADLHGGEAKQAKQRMNSATVELSKMRTTINALNGGMDRATCEKYWDNHFAELGWNAIVEVARTFTKSAAGRKPDTLLVKLGKWIEVQKKGGTPESAEDRQLLDDIIKFYNDRAPQ